MNKIIPKNPELKEKAKNLRKNMTKHERKLWFEFLATHNLKWRPQQIIDNYIVDFYSSKARMAIELDGSQHYEPENMKYDEKRTIKIEKFNIIVVRFTNLEIDKCFRDVCETIDYISGSRVEQSETINEKN